MVDRVAGVISVIMPAYNEERALPNTLRALFTQQGDFEVIVVDGGSTDQHLRDANPMDSDGALRRSSLVTLVRLNTLHDNASRFHGHPKAALPR